MMMRFNGAPSQMCCDDRVGGGSVTMMVRFNGDIHPRCVLTIVSVVVVTIVSVVVVSPW